MTADEYLRATYDTMRDGYTADCVTHAGRIAALLLEEGRAAWIGRIRDARDGFTNFLAPLRYVGRGGPAWTTHYVACCGGEAFDPILGAPTAVGEYTTAVFGRALDVVKHFDEVQTAELLRSGGFARAFRPR